MNTTSEFLKTATEQAMLHPGGPSADTASWVSETSRSDSPVASAWHSGQSVDVNGMGSAPITGRVLATDAASGQAMVREDGTERAEWVPFTKMQPASRTKGQATERSGVRNRWSEFQARRAEARAQGTMTSQGANRARESAGGGHEASTPRDERPYWQRISDARESVLEAAKQARPAERTRVQRSDLEKDEAAQIMHRSFGRSRQTSPSTAHSLDQERASRARAR